MSIDDFSLFLVFCLQHLPAAVLTPFTVFLCAILFLTSAPAVSVLERLRLEIVTLILRVLAVTPFAILILLVRLELQVMTSVLLCLDVKSLLTAVSEFTVKNLIVTELTLKRPIEERIFS